MPAAISVKLYAGTDDKEIIAEADPISISTSPDKLVFGQTAYIHVYAPGLPTITVSEGDTLFYEKKMKTFVGETLSFPGEKTANTSKPINLIKKIVWWGQWGEPGPLKYAQNVIFLLKKWFGIIELTYDSPEYTFTLDNVKEPAGYDSKNDPGHPILVVAEYGGKKAAATVLFHLSEEVKEEEEEEDDPWYFKVVNNCTKEPVGPGAVITFEGKEYVTDADSRAYIGMLPKGTHTIDLVQKEDFLPSNEDFIQNEEFEI